jgi:hypothetical protein
LVAERHGGMRGAFPPAPHLLRECRPITPLHTHDVFYDTPLQSPACFRHLDRRNGIRFGTALALGRKLPILRADFTPGLVRMN